MDYDRPSIQDEQLFGQGPPDRYRAAYLIVLLMGVGSLFPWNAFITAGDYFSKLYNPTFMSFLTLWNTYPNFFFMLLSVKFGARFSIRGRIIGSFLIMTAVFIAIPIFDYAGLENNIAKWSTWVCAALCGMATAIVGAAIGGYVAMLPPNYFGALMTGQGIAGIIVAALRMTTKAAVETGSPVTKEQLRLSAMIYFALAGAIIVGCIVSINVFVNLPFVKYHVNKSKDVEAQPLLGESGDLSRHHASSVAIGPVLRKLWLEAVEVFYIFFVTLSIFPGVMFQIKGDNPHLLQTGWLAVIYVALFQIFDYVGRQFTSIGVIPARWVWIPVILRTGFVPLFVFCVQPLFFVSNWWGWSFMVVFAMTNGYLGSVGMMHGPQRVSDHQKETAGTIMMVFLQLGIFLGLHFAFYFLWQFSPDAFWAIFGYPSSTPGPMAPFVDVPVSSNSTTTPFAAPMLAPIAAAAPLVAPVGAPMNQTLF